MKMKLRALSVLVVVGMMIAACGPEAATPTPVPAQPTPTTQAAAPTEAVEPTSTTPSGQATTDYTPPAPALAPVPLESG
ncbi:MAG TPA: hypothetical protein VFR15_04295, partial [Chloroflexia bacterium]|nr:hypothetical protein [Chloroflexia bacterium]